MGAGKVVFHLVANHATTDARVMKEAKALRDAGYELSIFGRSGGGFGDDEDHGGITVRRFACYAFDGLTEEMVAEVAAAIGLDPSWTAGMRRALLLHSRLALLEWKAVRLANGAANRANRYARTALSYLGGGRAAAVGGIAAPRPIALDRVQREFNELMFFCRHIAYACNLGRLEFAATPDIVHAHDIYALPGAVVLAKRFGAKLVYDAHEIETERVPPMPPDKKAFVDALERACLACVDELITVSAGFREFYRGRFADPKIIMNAPPTPQRGIARDVRDMLGFDRSVPLVIFTGGVAREFRGLHVVAAALALLPGVHLAVLGPRFVRDDQWLGEAAEGAGVADRIHLLPSVPADEVTAVIATADLAICPIQDVSLSYRHSMPNKLFEAAFAGLPVCVSDLPDMRAFVEELRIGVVMDQTDPASIAGAVREVLQNPDSYAGIADLENRLASKYSWQSQAVRLVDLYAGLTAAQAT